jgi:short subunit dehydrogenase-like uncharacterized protein
MKKERDYDVILWGASGFTGALVARHLATHYGVGGDLRWAIAGRDKSKLDALRSQLVPAGEESALPVLLADSHDRDSLQALVARARVICTTVGPYAAHGSELVAACVEQGTDYCDLTGEVPWMAEMIAQHQTRAEDSGARIVHTCGFDSIPSDLGSWHLQQQMRAVHGVWAQRVKARVGAFSGAASGGTIASMVRMIEQAAVDKSVRSALADPYSLYPQGEASGSDRADQRGAVYDRDFRQWTSPFVMAVINARVVRRSNALQQFPYGRDFRYDEAMLTGKGGAGHLRAVRNSAASLAAMAAMAVGPVRKLALGFLPAPGEGPTPVQQERGHFEVFFHGVDGSGSAELFTRVSGDRDPGYGATSRMLGEAAVCLARDELSATGGFLTPSTAMAKPLLDRLQSRAGMHFEVIDRP